MRLNTSFNLISKVSHELGIHKKYKGVITKYTSLRLNQRSNNMLNTYTKTYNLATLKIQHSTYDGHSTRKTLQYCLRRARSRHEMIINQQGKYQIEKNQVLDRRFFSDADFLRAIGWEKKNHYYVTQRRPRSDRNPGMRSLAWEGEQEGSGSVFFSPVVTDRGIRSKFLMWPLERTTIARFLHPDSVFNIECIRSTVYLYW